MLVGGQIEPRHTAKCWEELQGCSLKERIGNVMGMGLMTGENGGNVNLQDRGRGNLRVLHTCPQASTDKFLDDAVVENVYAAIRSKMPNSIVLGAGSCRNDRKRTRHSGRVWVLQMPLRAAVPIVFGPSNWFGGNSPCRRTGIVFAAHRHLAISDAHYETEITKVADWCFQPGARSSSVQSSESFITVPPH